MFKFYLILAGILARITILLDKIIDLLNRGIHYFTLKACEIANKERG